MRLPPGCASKTDSWGRQPLHIEPRMQAAEIERLDRENALLELEAIVGRVQQMAHISYELEIGEAWENLDIWAAGGNAEAAKLLIALKSALARMGPVLEGIY